MSILLLIIILMILVGGGGAHYARGRYGNAGLGGVRGIVLIGFVVLWLFGGMVGTDMNP